MTKIDPPKVELMLAHTMSKELKVKLNTPGEPPTGFTVSKAQPPLVWPGVVTVTGPRRVLAHATEIKTKPIPLSSLLPIADTEIKHGVPLEQSVEVTVNDKTTTEHIDCNQTVEYSIWLTQARGKKTLTKLPVKILTPPNFPYVARLVQSLEKVDLEVRGLEQNLDKLNASNVIAYVDVTDKRPTTGKPPETLTVKFILPEEVQGKVEIVNDLPKVGVDILEPPKDRMPPPVRP